MNVIIKNLPPKSSETDLANLLKPYLSALGLEPSDYDIAKPNGKWWALMRIKNQENAEEFLEKYGFGQPTGIKFAYQTGKTLKFEEAQSQDEEDCSKVHEDNAQSADTGCGCVIQ